MSFTWFGSSYEEKKININISGEFVRLFVYIFVVILIHRLHSVFSVLVDNENPLVHHWDVDGLAGTSAFLEQRLERVETWLEWFFLLQFLTLPETAFKISFLTGRTCKFGDLKSKFSYCTDKCRQMLSQERAEDFFKWKAVASYWQKLVRPHLVHFLYYWM